MSVYVMSDLHGDWVHFKLMLLKIKFSAHDHLYILGDVVDRGPHSIRLLNHCRQQENITLLLGNHELMLLESIQFCGKQLEKAWFDAKTFTELKKMSPVERADIAKYITTLPLFLTVSVGGQDYLLVHACPAPPEVHGNDALEYLLWTRVTPEDTASFSQPVIAGHTPTAYYQQTTPLRIWKSGNFTDIDCGTSFRSVLPGSCLACLRLDDGKEFYV